MAYSPFRNVGLKFLSICIAALLWLVVAGDRVVERALRVPIEFQNLPPGLEIVGDPAEAVDVRVRGSSGTLGRMVPGDTSAVIDLRSARPGRRLFHITATQIKVPYGLDVVQVAPATLPITFENSAIRIVQVRPSVEGRPAPGYELGGITTDPATVEVVGPESALRGLDEAMTEPVSDRQRHAAGPRDRDGGRCRSERAAALAADRGGHRADRVGRGHTDADRRRRSKSAASIMGLRGRAHAGQRVGERARDRRGAAIAEGRRAVAHSRCRRHDSRAIARSKCRCVPMPGITVESVTPAHRAVAGGRSRTRDQGSGIRDQGSDRSGSIERRMKLFGTDGIRGRGGHGAAGSGDGGARGRRAREGDAGA